MHHDCPETPKYPGTRVPMYELRVGIPDTFSKFARVTCLQVEKADRDITTQLLILLEPARVATCDGFQICTESSRAWEKNI